MATALAFAMPLLALLATASSQSCPVSGQTRIECASLSACQSSCANSNTIITCPAVCVVNGCKCPNGTFIDNETNSCVHPVGCAKLWCGLPQDPGNCGFNASSEVRYFFNATSGQCQQFEYAEGCSGNGNNFETMQECQDTCRCVLPSDPGPCEAHMPMYFHNATSGRCEMFVYGGCQGNDNRFTTLELCQQACSGEIEMSSDAPGIPGATVMPQWWMVPTLLLSAAATMLVTTM